MAGLTLPAPAKVNLVLRVAAPRPDGYHPVTTLLVAVDGLADTVRVASAPARRVICPGVAERDNLAWRAMDVLERATDRPVRLRVDIDKRIPAQAGLGGGSSDAAAVMRAARDLLGLALGDGDLERLAAEVGSDVPFFVRGGAQWATGRGEVLTPAEPPPGLWLLLTPPVVALPTALVYRAWDAGARPPALPPPDTAAPLRDWRRDGRVGNDLWPAALARAPRLGGVARALRAAGARRVLLCGSGGALAGLFGSAEDARAAAARPGLPVLAVTCPAPSGRAG
ncbi:MAG TPA: 4-(cytidine 5'-diphospho)-2-C-methyl-D-erythritol kinase [Egibacteraceae bacterium]|nr:4-(cytidine 5'-diphospho)-2-C-methyl-D-erythritol kinase [Egibacteraceae bacterium]